MSTRSKAPGRIRAAASARAAGSDVDPRRPRANSLALWLDPRPSGRRCTRQCTTRTPAARAAGSSRAMLGSASRRASSASAAKPASGPITAPWHSWVMRAVCPGADQFGKLGSYAMRAHRRTGWPISAAPYRVSHPASTARDVRRTSGSARSEVVPDRDQELLLDRLADRLGRNVGGVAGNPWPPYRIEHVRVLVVDRRAGEDQPVIRRALEHADRAAEAEQVAWIFNAILSGSSLRVSGQPVRKRS